MARRRPRLEPRKCVASKRLRTAHRRRMIEIEALRLVPVITQMRQVECTKKDGTPETVWEPVQDQLYVREQDRGYITFKQWLRDDVKSRFFVDQSLVGPYLDRKRKRNRHPRKAAQ